MRFSHGWPSRAPLLALAAILGTAFASLSAVPWAPAVFVAALLVLGYLPGRVAMALLRIEASPLARAVVSLVLGLAATTTAYWMLSLAAARHWFWIWPSFALGAWMFWRSRPSPTRRPGSASMDGRELLVLTLPLALAALALFFSPFYYRNLVRTPDGALTFYSMPDTVWHLSFTQELRHTVPPSAPFMPGRSLNYHYGMDTLTAAFSQVPGLEVADLAARFMPTLFFGIALTAAFCLGRALGLPCAAAAVCAFLVLFGEDFSFIPVLLRDVPPPQLWSAMVLQAPTIVSMFMMNPMLPALGLLLAAFYSIVRFAEARATGWAVVAAVLAAALFQVKVFAAVQLVLALGLAAGVCLWRFRDGRLVYLSIGVGVLLLPAVVTLLGGHLHQPSVKLQPGPYVPEAIFNLGLGGTRFGAGVAALFYAGRVSLGSVLAFGAAIFVYLFFVMGLRVYGYRSWLRAFVPAMPADSHLLVMACFVVIGPLLTLNLEVLPEGHDPAGHYNNAIWFLVQSKYLAWFFAFDALVASWNRGGRWGRLLLALTIPLLSLPSAVQYLAEQATHTPPAPLDRSVVDVAQFLRDHAVPGSVVVAPQYLAGPLISLSPCRATVPDAFGFLAADSQEIARRTLLLQNFWRAWGGSGSVADALRALGSVDFVVAPEPPGFVPPMTASFRAGQLAVYPVR